LPKKNNEHTHKRKKKLGMALYGTNFSCGGCMKYLWRVGLVPSLLIVGVLGGWLAPLSSEALNSIQPTVTFQGSSSSVNISMTRIPNANNACPFPDTAYNSCWSITPGTYGSGNDQWTVGHFNATSNKARVLINDSSATGSRDAMKMTGITFKPVVPGTAASPRVLKVIITHTFDEGGGNISGDYLIAMAQGGQFDPDSNENVIGNKLKQTGTGTTSGNFTSGTFALGTLDTGTFTTSTILDKVGYVTKSKAASVVKPACNTGSGRCAPKLKLEYEITVVGDDQLQLSDSVSETGGVCYKGLKLDKFDHLRDEEHPLGCTKFAEAANEETADAVAAIVATGIASGGEAVETCLGACIVINKTVDPDLNVPGQAMFDFTGTGNGITNFTLTTNGEEDGGESTTFSNLVAGASGWTITETGFPYAPDIYDDVPPGESDHDSFWWTHTVSCESALNAGGASLPPPGTEWTTHDVTFNDVHPYRKALGNDASLGNEDPLPTDSIPDTAITYNSKRQGYVTVTNLAAHDTLTCTFKNRLYNDDHPNNDPDGD
jgi:hypothetical protein